MLQNLTIFQKGLALGFVLLILEFASLFALLKQDQTANSLNNDLSQMTEVYCHTQGVISTLYESRDAFFHWLDGSDPHGLEKFRKLADESNSDFQFLKEKRKLFEGQDNFNNDLALKITDIENLRSDWLQKVADKVAELNTLAPDERSTQKVESEEILNARSKAQQKLVALSESVQERLSTISQDELSNYKYMQTVSTTAILGNILLTIFIGIFLGRDLVLRLKIMVQNTERLSEERELLPALKGKDELAQSDALFHQLEKEISGLRQLKRTYIQLFRKDLSTPLNKVKDIFSQLQSSLTDKAKETIITAERNLERLINIIDDLTSSETKGANFIRLRKKHVNANELIRRSIESVSSFADEHGVQIQSESCQEEIFADGDRLIQVLVNLLSNASKFSPKNSIVHITCTATNGSLQFSVSDTGRGIPKDKIGSLFEKFSQADEKDGRRGVGTGLGLSICKTIVELHGGQINAESEIGKGSRFWFVIPRTSTEEPAK